jgi:hypothetical protein
MKKYLLTFLLLAGCGSIPTAGPVTSGLEIGAVDQTPAETIFPRAPRRGASQLEIVTGFLAANASPLGDYSIAREYLADAIAAEWSPSAGIQVFETALNLSQANQTTVSAVGIPKLTLDEEFRPSFAPSLGTQSVDFFLTQELGEWRITNPPAGILLPRTEFQRNFEIATLWFVDKQRTKLVPDFIAISQRLDAATQLVRALSYGSNEWLKPAVVNLLDSQISGGLESVQQIDSRVIVDFNVELLRLNNREQSLLIGQLAQTLQPLTDVAQLEVTVGGQLLSVSGIANPMDLATDNWPGNRSVKVTNLYAISTSGDLVQPTTNLRVSSWLSEFSNPSDLSIASDEQRIAVSLPSRGEIAVGYRSQLPRIINQVSQVTDLNFDANGTLWFVNQSSRTLFGYDGINLLPANLEIPPGSQLSHAMVGPDNVRVAVISQSGSQATLSIVRLAKSDRNIALQDRLTILNITGSVASLNWFSSTEVVMLVFFPNQQEPVAVLANIATAAQTIVQLPAGATYLAANGFGSLVAQDGQQRIWLRSQSSWDQIGTGISATFPRE